MKSQADLVIRNASLCHLGGKTGDVAIAAGKILSAGPRFEGSAKKEIDAAGLLLSPGFIDSHVHLNEPGRTPWEGLSTGTKALAAGGVTAFFDMPLNSSPPATDATQLVRKREAALKKSWIDFGLWGGLVPGNEDQIAGLARAGAIGIKAFMCGSGLEEFPASDKKTILRGAKACAANGLVLAFHAEDPAELARFAKKQTARDWRAYAASRPESVEVKAVRTAIAAAAETGCKIHIVHISSPEAVGLVAEARRKGIDATCEACTHYLVFDESAMETRGAAAKCSPPLRPAATRAELRDLLRSGQIHTIGSDHSPAPPSMKTGADFFKIWGGISGAQHAMRFFWRLAEQEKIPLRRIVELTSAAPARRFSLIGKGTLARGADADIVLLRRTADTPVTRAELFTRHKITPYLGLPLGLSVETTIVRGAIVYHKGTHRNGPAGKEVRRNPPQQ
jgi:allantoinase